MEEGDFIPLSDAMLMNLYRERRLKKVAITFQLMEQMLHQDYKVEHGIECVQGVPPDAILVGSYTDSVIMVGYLIFHHPSFDITPWGQVIPSIEVTHRKFTVPDDPEV